MATLKSGGPSPAQKVSQAKPPRADNQERQAQHHYDVDDGARAELVELYREAVENIRFSKAQQWRTLIYFTALVSAVVTIGVFLRWGDRTLIGFLFYSTWFFSIATVIVLVLLQSWQATEQKKLHFIVAHFSDVSKAALRRKSRTMGDIHRYTLLGLMLVYVELASIAVSRMMWPHF